MCQNSLFKNLLLFSRIFEFCALRNGSIEPWMKLTWKMNLAPIKPFIRSFFNLNNYLHFFLFSPAFLWTSSNKYTNEFWKSKNVKFNTQLPTWNFTKNLISTLSPHFYIGLFWKSSIKTEFGKSESKKYTYFDMSLEILQTIEFWPPLPFHRT